MTDLVPVQQLIDHVGIDKALELLEIFKQDAQKRLSFMEAYLDGQNGDVAELRRQAHSLKGMCRTYGAVTSGNAAERLQTACDENQIDQIEPLISRLIATLPANIEAVITAVHQIKEEESGA